MNYQIHDIRELSRMLEAEAAGHRIDRDRAQELAARLAHHHPEIGRTMRLILDRMDRPN